MSPAIDIYLLFPTLLVLIVSVLALRGNKRWRMKGKNIPPGSTGWPLIGETLSFIKHHPSNSIGDYMEKRVHKYGLISTTNILGTPTILSMDPELTLFIFHNDGKLFASNWPKSMVEVLGHDSVLSTSGDVHKYLKAYTIGFLGISRLKDQFFKVADSSVRHTLSTWKENTTISLKEEARKVTFNMIAKNILSLNPGEPETDNLFTLFTSLITGVMALPLNFPGTAYRKALEARESILKVIKELAEERRRKKREKTDTIGEDDFMGYVLEHSEPNMKQFGDLMLGFVFVGHESTTAAISMAIYFLQDCPKAVEQLREEHLKISRTKLESGESATLTWEDYKKMEFTHSVIRETLRLGNVGMFLFRKAVSDIHFKGYDIPSGWAVFSLLSAAFLDPSVYPDPQKFDPWRWQTGSNNTIGMDNYLPFGKGVRKCIGGDLAKMMISVFLHHLVLNYNWEPVEPDHPYAFIFPEFPKGLPIKVHKMNSFQ